MSRAAQSQFGGVICGVVLAAQALSACTPVTTSQRSGSIFYGAAPTAGTGGVSGTPFYSGAGVGSAGNLAPGPGPSVPSGGSGGAGGAGFPSNPGYVGSGGAGGVGVPSAGTGGNPAIPTGPTSNFTSMTFEVLTHVQVGQFQPANAGAIWIETSSGQFVKTLQAWAFIREIYLSKFRAEAMNNKTDAVTSASLPNHVTHHVSWNLKDASGNPAPDGAYKLIVECTDSDLTGQFVAIDFMKAPGAAPITPADTPAYSGMRLAFQ